MTATKTSAKPRRPIQAVNADMRKAFAQLAKDRGLTAEGMVALAGQIGARRRAAALAAADAALARQTYESVFGRGAFAADARSR